VDYNFPSNISSSEMRWESEGAEARWKQIMHTKRGPVYIGELAEMLVKAGVKKELVARRPRNVYEPNMLVEPLRRIFTQPEMKPDLGSYRAALERAKSKFCLLSPVKPLTLEQAMDRMDQSTNAGLPSLMTKCEVYEETLILAKKVAKGKCPNPMVVFYRGKNEEEARPVQCYPWEMHANEARFFYPLQKSMTKPGFRNPYTAGRTKVEVDEAMNRVAWDTELWFCMDYSGFDRSISARLLNDAFRILRDNLRIDKADHKMFDRIITYFITGPMLLPDGRVYSGRRHGVPSGSMFTQMIDSIVNAIAIEYLIIRTKSQINGYWVTGDDSVLAIKGNDFSIAKAALILKELGLVVNLEKSMLVNRKEDATYLGHYARGVAVRDNAETWDRMVNPERPKPPLFSKNEEVRHQFYAQIVRGHLQDNADAFPELYCVLEFLEGRVAEIRHWQKGRVRYYRGAMATRASELNLPRKRWDEAYRLITSVPTTGPALGALLFY